MTRSMGAQCSYPSCQVEAEGQFSYAFCTTTTAEVVRPCRLLLVISAVATSRTDSSPTAKSLLSHANKPAMSEPPKENADNDFPHSTGFHRHFVEVVEGSIVCFQTIKSQHSTAVRCRRCMRSGDVLTCLTSRACRNKQSAESLSACQHHLFRVGVEIHSQHLW